MSIFTDTAFSFGTPVIVKNEEFWENIEWLNPEDAPSEQVFNARLQENLSAEPMRLLRLERDGLIASTDWWVLPDRTPTQAQLDYRQALRDLPANSPNAALDENGQLINVTWPVKPE